MCASCGCANDSHELHHHHADGDAHHHPHGDHDHDHVHGKPSSEIPGRAIRLELEVLAKNNLIAAKNREFLAGSDILALNFVSAPGSGKTALLESTIRRLVRQLPLSVVEGDQETDLDAARIRQAGCPVVQINTGAGCHLDAGMVAKALRELAPRRGSVVLIENVGNLVCPALFDLGEQAKVVVMSVTEGEDKPLKYPHMFRASAVMILNKIDLLPHVAFDAERCIENALRVNPRLRVFELSATRGDGFDPWCEWLQSQAQRVGLRTAPGEAP